MPAQLIEEFDIWQPRYGGAIVTVYIAGTTAAASIFTDEALTVAASNPQTLSTNSDNAGKFAASLYTSSAYYLDVDGTDNTGVKRPPLSSLSGIDASAAVVTSTGGSASRTLADRFDDHVHALDYGALGASSATNNTTLTAAIGAAAASGGGVVHVPAGTYEFTGLTLSQGVVLEGAGRGVTTLQCQTGGDCITISGDRAGLRNLTFDGVTVVVSSVGVFSKANDETVFDDVDIKRFVTGLHFKGGRRAAWRDLYVTNCTTGARLHGDNDAGGGADGDEYRHNRWCGGQVSQCTTIGIDLSFEDMKCWHNSFVDVGFDSNTGNAFRINGARWTALKDCWWISNTTNFAILDDDDTTNSDVNTILGLFIHGGMLSGGAATLDDSCDNVVFDSMEINDVDFTLTSVDNNILVRDCIEDSLVTLAGATTRWLRWGQVNKGGVVGVTTDATATKAWAMTLEPGIIAFLTAHIAASQRDGTGYASYEVVCVAQRPGATLDYDTQTANYTVGDVLTGGTSGATARIIADADSGATGTLTLKEIVGTFENNEIITDTGGGSALVNGVITEVDVALRLASTINHTAESIAGLTSVFVLNASEIELQVTGEAAKTYDWTVYVEAVTG